MNEATMTKEIRLQLMVDDEFLNKIDEFRRTQTPIPSKSEAVRMLVEMGLKYTEEKEKDAES